MMRLRVSVVRERAPEWDTFRTGTVLKNGSDVAAYFEPVIRDLAVETFWAVHLDGRNRVQGIEVVSVGSMTATLVHPREVFCAAIIRRTASLVLAHNHPSGDPEPSSEDLSLTTRLHQVGELVGIRVLDHVVLAPGLDAGRYRYVSLAERGAL